MRHLFLFLILFLSACHTTSSKNYQVPDYEKMADRITAMTAKKIEAETGLQLCGIGGGMMNHIRMMAMSFDCVNEISLEQGRELLIYCVNEYLSAINSNEKIRPYLVHYPFTPKDIEIEIFISRSNYAQMPIGALSVVCEVDGVLKYKISQLGTPSIKTVHIEPYEEAVKLVETENSSVGRKG